MSPDSVPSHSSERSKPDRFQIIIPDSQKLFLLADDMADTFADLSDRGLAAIYDDYYQDLQLVPGPPRPFTQEWVLHTPYFLNQFRLDINSGYTLETGKVFSVNFLISFRNPDMSYVPAFRIVALCRLLNNREIATDWEWDNQKIKLLLDPGSKDELAIDLGYPSPSIALMEFPSPPISSLGNNPISARTPQHMLSLEEEFTAVLSNLQSKASALIASLYQLSSEPEPSVFFYLHPIS